MEKTLKKRKHEKNQELEEKWGFYEGAGIVAKRGKNSLALRKKIGGGEFAIVKLFGGFWTNSPIKVLEEIKTGSLKKASRRFEDVAKKLSFRLQPLRELGSF